MLSTPLYMHTSNIPNTILFVCLSLSSVFMNGSVIQEVSLNKKQGTDHAIVSMESPALTFESNRLKLLFTRFNLSQLTPELQRAVEKSASSQILLYNIGESPTLPKVKVILENEQHVSHVGFDIFQHQELDTIQSAGLFIERYFLYLFSEDKKQRIRHIEADHLVVTINGLLFGSLGSPDFSSVLSLLSSNSSFSLNSKDYVFQYKSTDPEGNELNIMFPSRLDLISGKDKKELDDELNKLLKLLPPATLNPAFLKTDSKTQLIPTRDGHFRTEGKTLQPGLTSMQYYKKADSGYELVFDSDSPIMSLQNYLITPLKKSVQIKIDYRGYGEQHVIQSVDLTSLIEIFKKENDVYVGFEKTNTGTIRSTQIFKNRTFDMSHMLIIEWSDSLLWSTSEDPVTGKLYSYIRNDNVENLIGKYIEKPGIVKIPIEVKQE
ncbi:MAG: hypothetical protein AB8G77_28640 [Rhodothermales bacterium]